MEKLKKNMHLVSIAVFVLLVHRLITGVQATIALTTMDFSTLDAAGQMIAPMVNTVLLCGSVIFSILFTLLGFKGLAEAKSPSSSRYHIALAQLLGVLFVLTTINSIVGLFSTANVAVTIIDIVISLANIAVFFFYASTARKLRVAK